jgi:hypothetical protein
VGDKLLIQLRHALLCFLQFGRGQCFVFEHQLAFLSANADVLQVDFELPRFEIDASPEKVSIHTWASILRR